MGGGGGKSSGSQKDPAASALANLATQFATETEGLRTGFINQLMGILSNPSGKSGFDEAGYNAAMAQYNRDLAAWRASGGRSGGVTTAGTPTPTTSKPSPVAQRFPSLFTNEAKITPEGVYIPAIASTSQTATTAAPIRPSKSDYSYGGGVQIPLIAAAQENARRAASLTNKETQAELARTGLTGTPFGQRAMTESRREGNYNVGQASTDVMMQLFSLIPSFVLGQGQTATSGLAGAVGGNVKGKGKSFGIGK